MPVLPHGVVEKLITPHETQARYICTPLPVYSLLRASYSTYRAMSMVTSLPVLGNPMQGAIIARDDLSSDSTSAPYADPKRLSSTDSSEDEKGEKGNWTTETEVIEHSEVQGVVIGSSSRFSRRWNRVLTELVQSTTVDLSLKIPLRP